MMLALFLMIVSFVPTFVSSSCLMGSFDFEFTGSCNYENILDSFESVFNDPINTPEDCDNSAEQEFIFLVNATDAVSAGEKAKDICRKAVENMPARLPLENVPGHGLEFIEQYYNGATYLNEEHETNYPKTEDDKPTNVLKIDFQRAKQVYNAEGRYGIIDWPGELFNFNLDSCKMNAAKCCFAQDRQANDNNGNCATPYDANCEDKDPADNANLCHVDLERGVNSTGYEGAGTMIFPKDNAAGEGPIHCHGFAWANDDTDYTNYYKGNNLFYVSMYDHLYQRGYVRNFPGAPMCACLEQTPVTDRADCTEIDVQEEKFKVMYDGEKWDAIMTYARIAFASCQGYGRDGNRNNGNDLWPHMHRLYVQGKLTLDQLRAASKVLVSDEPDTCNLATKHELEKSEGLVTGYNHDPNTWVKIVGKGGLKMTEAFGGISFNDLLYNSPNGIYRRVCASCDVRAQHIYIKRHNKVNMPRNHLAYIITANSKKDPGYVHGVDFDLYSTYEDAKAGTNKFVCKYDYGNYFPGKCSPDGTRLVGQYSSFYSSFGQPHVAYYVEKGVDSPDLKVVRSTTINYIDFKTTVFGVNKYQGSVREDGNGTYYITNSGAALYGSHNDYTYLHSNEPVEGDLDISVKIGDVDDKEYWTKTGILIRETLDPYAKTVFPFINQQRFTNVQWKSTSTDHDWRHTSNNRPTSYLRLIREGDEFSTYFKQNFDDDWLLLYKVTVEMNPSVYIGLALAGHNSGQLAEAKVSNFEFERFIYPSAAPTGSSQPTVMVASRDIGSMSLKGSSSVTGSGQYRINGSGEYFWYRNDHIHFVNFPYPNGDYMFTAYVANVESTNEWAKAGINIRSALCDDAKNVFVGITPLHSVYQYRTCFRDCNTISGSKEYNEWSSGGWVMIMKIGNTFTAFNKHFVNDPWDPLGFIEINMDEPTIEFGLAVSSNDKNDLATAIIQDVSIIPLDTSSSRSTWMDFGYLFPEGFNPINVALFKPAKQSSTEYGGDARRAVDGNTSGMWNDYSVTQTKKGVDQWWEVDLEESFDINMIIIYNRVDCCSYRLNDYILDIYDGSEIVYSKRIQNNSPPVKTIDIEGGTIGNKVKITTKLKDALSLAEVEVFGERMVQSTTTSAGDADGTESAS